MPVKCPASYRRTFSPEQYEQYEQYSRLRILPWNDSANSPGGFDPRSLYVETFWLGTLGPTATWLTRLVAYSLDEYPEGITLDAEEIARRIGVGTGTGRNSALSKTLRRCARFDIARLSCLSPPASLLPIPALTTPASTPPAPRPAAQLPAAATQAHSPAPPLPPVSTVSPLAGNSILIVEIRRRMPALPDKYVRQLPGHLRWLHASFLAGEMSQRQLAAHSNRY